MYTHIFVDAENVMTQNVITAVSHLSKIYDVNACDVISKTGTMPTAYKNYRPGVFRLKYCNNGKNSADMLLTVEVARAVYEEADTERIVIISNDRDFAPIIKLATDMKRRVMLILEQNALLRSLQQMDVDFSKIEVAHVSNGHVAKKSKLKKAVMEDYLRKANPEPVDPGTRRIINDYLKRHNYRGETVFVKRGEDVLELPFIDGMNAGMFSTMLKAYGIYQKKQMKWIIEGFYLKVCDDGSVRRLSEEEFLRKFSAEEATTSDIGKYL